MFDSIVLTLLEATDIVHELFGNTYFCADNYILVCIFAAFALVMALATVVLVIDARRRRDGWTLAGAVSCAFVFVFAVSFMF